MKINTKNVRCTLEYIQKILMPILKRTKEEIYQDNFTKQQHEQMILNHRKYFMVLL